MDWEKISSEIDELINLRYQILDSIDGVSNNNKNQCMTDGNVTLIDKIRVSLAVNYSKTKDMYKRYGLKVTVHAIYDYVMAKTIYCLLK